MEAVDRFEEEAVQEANTTYEAISESDEEQADELEDIQGQMMDLCRYALTLVVEHRQQAARSYWYGHIMSSLGSDEYPERSYTMAESVQELREQGDEDEEDDGSLDYARRQNEM